MEISSSGRATRVALACVLASLTVLVTAGPAAAQNESTPKWDIFAGYQWLHPNITVPAPFSDPSNPTPFVVPDMSRGLGGALTYNVDKHWGMELDLGYNWKDGTPYNTTISGGPRFMWGNEGVKWVSFSAAVWILHSPRCSRFASSRRITCGRTITFPS